MNPKIYLDRVVAYLEDVVNLVPTTTERRSRDPYRRGREIGGRAAAHAAMVAGGLSLPSGPWGFLTILPDLVSVWKIQAQMIADISGAFGQKARLGREQMLYCLFKHAASQAVRDLVIRVGERVIISEVSFITAQTILRRVSARIPQKVAGRAISRCLPVVGAVAVGAYAFYDTAQVAKTTMDLMGKNEGI